jgi:anti-sigma factor RsiW
MPLNDNTLVAYADGELDAARAREVEAAMAVDAKVRGKVEIFRETSEVLRGALGHLPRQTVSPRSVRALDPPKREVSRRWRFAVPLAASLAILAVGLGGGYLVGVQHAQQQTADTGVDHWLEEAAKYYELYARDDSYLVEITAAHTAAIEEKLGGWLARDLQVPDLSRHGLAFRGVRFVALEANPVGLEQAQPTGMLVYDTPDGKPLALSIIPFSSTGEVGQTLARWGDINALYWIKMGYGYVLLGWAEEDLLRAVASDAALQLGKT